MRKLNTQQGIFIFYLFDIILLLIFILAFLPFSKKNIPQTQESALLNPNYIDQIASITIITPSQDEENQSVILTKYDSFWLGTDSTSQKKYYWPCDSSIIDNLIKETSKIRTMYLVGKGVSSWKSLGVEEKEAKCIEFRNEVGGLISSLYFGLEDSLTQRISVRSGANQAVYQIANEIHLYLTASSSFWSDPYIYPQCVTEYSRTESEQFLRHGLLQNISPASHIKPIKNITKNFDNKSKVLLSIYSKDDVYIVIPSFEPPPSYSEREKLGIESINYRYSISKWTYERFLESID